MKGFDPERIRQSNKMYQTLTIAYAMLDHLTSKSQMTGVWAKVIKKHFRVHGKEILHVVKRWARGNQHLYNCGSGRRNPVAELEKALSRI